MPAVALATDVRPATLVDIPALVAMGQAFLHASHYARFYADNPAQVAQLAERLITSPGGVVFVAEKEGQVVGMLAAVVYDHFISAQRVASEVVFWVDPASRGLGLKLLRATERWARAQGALALQMISPNAEVDRLYDRLGFSPIERAFQKDL